jgi:XTP/dITP diphosphohydrolase
MKLLVATTNAGKIREIGAVLAGQVPEACGLELLGLNDLQGISQAEENGATFEENALIKARHCYSLSGIDCVADDSGLEVDALSGGPGVLSARYAGPQATDQDRVSKLLDELKQVPMTRRGARFVCIAAFAGSEGEKVFAGYAEGVILTAPRGDGGFGYDPIFYYEPLGRTFAELATDEKSRISHRGVAFAQMGHWLAGGRAG